MRQTRQAKRATGLLVAALLVLLLTPSTAPAVYNPLASGQTSLHLSRSLTRLLARHRVKLRALAPATLRGGVLSLPVHGGHLDSHSGRGTVSHAGALRITSPRGSLTIREFRLRTTSTPLIANTNGPLMALVGGKGLSLPREGFGQGVRYRTLRLSAPFALRLDKRLGLHRLLKSGRLLGSLKTKTQPALVAIAARGELSLQPDPQTFSKLEALHVAVNPVFPAEHIGGAFSFPIILNGRLAPGLRTGTLRAGGSLELLHLGEGQSAQLFLQEAWLDFGAGLTSAELDVEPSPPFQGRSERPSLLGMSLAGASVSQNPAARTITVQGATLSFNQTLAAAFDEAFAGGKEEFKARDLLGTVGFVAGAE